MKKDILFQKYIELFGDKPPYPPRHIMETLVKMKTEGTFDKAISKAPQMHKRLEEILGEEITLHPNHPIFDIDFRDEKTNILPKLNNLMKCLLYTYDLGTYDDNKLRNDVYELDRIRFNVKNYTESEDDILWSNDIWKKYECDKVDAQAVNWNDLGKVKVLFNENGDIIERYFFNKVGEKDGKWTFWYENGQKESEETYKDGEMISSKKWDEDGNLIE